ncbi:MAG TPA: ATP-binding protein, partial [Streptosporangiaceae bacterium]|nr:ATP-binding protein [Streptosporangiaceae bacterium]
MRERSHLVASAAYQPDPAAAASARRFVRQTLQSWDIASRSIEADRLVDDAVLLTSELVTNAVVHAGTDLDVTCRIAAGDLEIAVRDRHPSRTLPDIPEAASLSAERGRGLLLPSALASSWGVTYARTAKAVWFRMSLARAEADDDEAAPPAGTSVAGTASSPAELAPAGASAGAGGPAEWLTGRDGATAGFVTAQVAFTGTDPNSDELASSPRRGAALAPLASHPPARIDDEDDPAAALRPDLGTLSYDELLRHTVETARDVVTADAAYALVADEDGELRVRAAAGVGVSESLFAPSVPAVFADGAAAKSLVTVPFLVDGRVTGVLGAAATSPDRFDGSDAARLQRVADRVAMSLER